MNKNTQTQTVVLQQKLDQQLLSDFKNAALAVSALVNLAVFISWLTIILA